MYDRDLLKRLGLNEDAALKDIEEAYDLIVRQASAKQRTAPLNEEEKKALDECTEAYNKLTGKSFSKRERGKEVGDWNQGLNKKTVRNFFYVFKTQIIVGAVIAVILGMFINDMLRKPVYDFMVCAFTNVYYNEEKLDDQISEAMPEIGSVGYQGGDLLSPQAFLAKYTVGTFDIIMMNKEQFDVYAKEGYFIDLDDLAKEYPIPEDILAAGSLKAQGEETEHFYGIDGMRCPALNEVVAGGRIMIGISNSSKRKDEAKEYIRYLMSRLK